ncbi:leucine-rich repeat-containing protein 59-like [Hetaerina americana]|uniref:leucine-rich repeat-containing protein 59-like n=1 Tax=Hetaerina americana TaxID=62018 RepID=UPI003A7F523E
MSKLNLRDRFEDGELDLSMSDIEEVPVKEIISIKKARTLDLSNNRITKLAKNFATMTHIVKLDLGKNFLTELPENFGDMIQLRHLDLYSNKIDRLPLSFGRLKNLRWLDLKGNPLVPKLAEVAGPCVDAAECAKCARAVVSLLHKMAVSIEEEKARREQQRQLQQTEAQNLAPQPKKETKKKRKGGGAKAESNADGRKQATEGKRNSFLILPPEMQNGSGELRKGQPPRGQKKGRGCGFWLYLFLIPFSLLMASGVALFLLDESLFWHYTETTQVLCKEGVSAVVGWWETQGLQGVKNWAGGGLEAARSIILQFYSNMSSQIPIYIESARNLF